MGERNSITFLWKIENFSHCIQEKSERLESPDFYVNCLTESMWKLYIFPRGISNSNEVKVYLHNSSLKENCVLFIDYEISFLSDDGSALVSDKVEDIEVEIGSNFQVFSYPTIDEIIERACDFLPQSKLTIQCKIWKSKKNLAHSLSYFARTRIGLQQRSFHWTVAEFSKLKINEKKVHRFIMDKDQPTFLTEVFLSQVTVSQASVEFEIKQITKNISKLFATGKISVLDTKGQIFKSMVGSYWFKPDNSIWRFPRFLTKNEVRASAECMVGDTLNLLLDLTFTTGIVYSNIESILSKPNWVQLSLSNASITEKIPQSVSSNRSLSVLDYQIDAESLAVLLVDLLSLYKDKTLSDFELRTESKSIPVHKNVLAARSPVFKAMFTSGMKEGADDFLDIPDLDTDTLDRLVMFVYTGNVEELEWSSASKLYYAADKYDILSLKQKCCTCLTNNIVNSNVCEILTLADRHNDERLKSSVHDFILSNDKEIISSAKWKQFLIENTALAAETLQLIYSKKLNILPK